jgi:HlyD family secretion protein
MLLALQRTLRSRLGAPAFAGLALALAAGVSCTKRRDTRLPIETAAVVRRTIISEATATGSVEPINVVEVKSKSSGQISEMTVETGSQVQRGDLLVQLDTRDVRNQYDQAKADLDAAQAKLTVSATQLRRNRQLAADRVITAQELEAQLLDSTNAASAVIRARTNLDLAQQRLDDATVRAPSNGTILTKTVALGQVIASATSSASGGTTLLTMADLSRVRVRANFNETDIANVHPGQDGTLTVDAYPDRPFRGTVEKIEPQAVVVQSVTFFPVLVTLDNSEGLLKPGMNGEISVLVDTRENVLAVPNDAIRTTREAANTARLLGLNSDSVVASVQQQTRALMGGGALTPNGNGANGGGRGGRGEGGRRSNESRGEVALPADQQGTQGQEGQRGRRGMGNLPQVSDAECGRVRDAFARNPKAQDALQSLRGRGGQGGEMDFQRVRQVSDSIYKALGIDGQVARACNMRDRQQGGGQGGGAAPSGQGTQAAGGRSGPRGDASRGSGAEAQPEPVRAGELPMRRRGAVSLVYVAQGTGFVPRVIRSGLSDLDYTEVSAGLQEGERVLLLAAVQLQAQRDSANARARAMQGGFPGTQKGGPGGGPGGAGSPGRGRGGG